VTFRFSYFRSDAASSRERGPGIGVIISGSIQRQNSGVLEYWRRPLSKVKHAFGRSAETGSLTDSATPELL
jgi:hypothetical protein